jgi:hypothetical protein
MSEEIKVTPPNIWKYDECNAVNTDAVNLKDYKPVGQFYHDAHTLCTMFGIKMHPIFREPTVPSPPEGEVDGFDDQRKPKEPTTIIVNKYRLDANSMKVLFKVLDGCSHIQTLK